MGKKELKEFADSMTREEKEAIEYERKIKQKNITKDNPIAFKLASLSDTDYVQFLKQLSACERTLFAVLSTKKKIERNTVDMMKGSTEQKFSSGAFEGQKKDLDDLKAENIINTDVMFEGIEGIRQVLTNLYFQHVGNVRLGDKEVYFNEEEFNKYIEKVTGKLKEQNLDLFGERQKKLIEN